MNKNSFVKFQSISGSFSRQQYFIVCSVHRLTGRRGCVCFSHVSYGIICFGHVRKEGETQKKETAKKQGSILSMDIIGHLTNCYSQREKVYMHECAP